MFNGTWFHDGPDNNPNGDYYFNGRISDVAIYNTRISGDELYNHALSVLNVVNTENEEFNLILDQLTQLVQDAHYRGYNLLDNDDLTTYFNENNSSKLVSEGDDLTADGLGIARSDFTTEDGILSVIESVDDAITHVRSFTSSLAVDLNILQIRQNFTKETINTLRAGQDDLRVADQNEEGANLLALQTRQQMGVTALSLAAQSANSVLNLFA